MKVEFDIQLQQQDVYGFHMYHNYHRLQTWFFTLLGIVIFVLGLTTFDEVEIMYSLMYVLCGLVFVFYTPLNLRTTSKLAVRPGNPLAEKFHYAMDEEGVRVSFAEKEEDNQEEDSLSGNRVAWDKIYRVVETKKHILIYTSRINASILPKAQIAEQLGEVKELLGANVPAYRLKLKKQ